VTSGPRPAVLHADSCADDWATR